MGPEKAPSVGRKPEKSVKVVIPGDPAKGETGRIVEGTPLEPERRAKAPRATERSDELRGHDIAIYVKHRGEYRYLRTVDVVPDESELRDMVPAFRHRAGRVKLVDELGNKKSFIVHPLHPIALAARGYDVEDDERADAPPFVFPPPPPPAPSVDWAALMAAAAPIVGAFVGLLAEAIKRPAPAPAEVKSTGGSLTEAIDALTALQRLNSEMRPASDADDSGLGGIVQGLMSAFGRSGGPSFQPPFQPPPFQPSVPGGFVPSPGPARTGPPPVAQPGVPLSQPPAHGPSEAAAAVAAAVRAGPDRPVVGPGSAAAPPPPEALDPKEAEAKRRLGELVAACGIPLDEAISYLHGYTDGSWQGMLVAAEAGLRNLANTMVGGGSGQGVNDDSDALEGGSRA